MEELVIREAAESDLDAIREIFNYSIEHSTCIYRTEPETREERLSWFEKHHPPFFATVAVLEGRVAGWASLSHYRPGNAYDGTAEDSVYIHRDFQRRGIGRRLMEDLIRRGREAGFHSIIAVISADQTPSIHLHERFGFKEAGRLLEVGRKYDRLLDVVHMQLML
jgi:phosphinothricin acetyltransferase